jgi:hypothetical protein
MRVRLYQYHQEHMAWIAGKQSDILENVIDSLMESDSLRIP